MEIVFLFAGLSFIAIGALILVSEARMRSGAAAVAGELIGFSTGTGRGSGEASYYAIAQYAGPDGQTRYLEASVGSSSPLGSVGDPLTVLVHPSDPDKAAIKSSLPYVLGGALVAMGLVSSVVFFAVFRISALSLAGAVSVSGWTAWKLRGAGRDKPALRSAWQDYRSKLFGARIFTDASKGNIAWADPDRLQKALRSRQKANRWAIPILLLAGGGLLVLGIHLHQQTGRFLERAVRGRGVVVDLVASDSTDSVTWAPAVEFEHQGLRTRFKDSIGSNPPSYRRGDEVDVLYDPSRPADARIDRGRWNKALPVLIGAFGGVLCAVAVWMVVARRQERFPATERG